MRFYPFGAALTSVRRVGGLSRAIRLLKQKADAVGPLEALKAAARHLQAAEEQIHSDNIVFREIHNEPIIASPHGDDPIHRRYRALQEDAQRRFLIDVSQQAAAPENRRGERIAVLMPVYKVPVEFLRRTIDSVIRQTYPNWELCIVDDFSEDDKISDLLTKYQVQDNRIKVLSLNKNLGISGASNAALEMVESRYFCLLDHDDMLTCDALETVASVLCNIPAPDIIYSDECKLDEYDNVHEIFLKPDWDAYLMHNSMYIGHLTTYRTEVVRALGGFRSEYDFSQDYDLALRVSELHRNVVHIPKILYGWRMIPESAASGGKPFARATNIAALQDAIERRGWDGRVEALPTANRIMLNRSRMDLKVSIIIPSDNLDMIAGSLESLQKTTYSNYDIVIVTNSSDIRRLRNKKIYSKRSITYVPYDLPFNFSDKCNCGAAAAEADVLIFYNDDVRVKSPDWIEAILDYILMDGVGAVGPKLLYENGTIQHAGMITGVRGLFGTAFHVLSGDSAAYFNFIQSVRQVSNLCGACLAVRKEVFERVGGFDTIEFPIAHSDGDLCFKIRAAGLACVYTPHAELLHIGHASIGAQEKARPGGGQTKDKADIRALKKWPSEISYDPFFPPGMTGILYHDSQEPYLLYPPTSFKQRSCSYRKDILLVFHDLTNSGAPRVLFEIASHLIDSGHFVVAISPSDGPFADKLRRIGVFVIIDALVLRRHEAVRRFVKNFDIMLANTIVAWPIVKQCAADVDTYWYIHESGLVSDLCLANREVREAFKLPKGVWATCPRVRNAVAPYRSDVQINEIGLSVPEVTIPQRANSSESVTIAVVGSIEPRKGQDLAIAAVQILEPQLEIKVYLRIVGRTLDADFCEHLKARAGARRNIEFTGELELEQALREIANADIVLVPSRDEPFSLVGLEALALQRIVVLGPEVGLFSYLEDEKTAFLASSSTPEDLAETLLRAIRKRPAWADIGQAARGVFDNVFSRGGFRRRVQDYLGLLSPESGS